MLAACVLLCACESPKREREEREDAKRLDDFYETAWVDCVNDLGMERCRVIQETGFQQCHNYRTAGATMSPTDCMQQRFDDRLGQIKESEGAATRETEPDPANPRGAPPLKTKSPGRAAAQPEPPPEAPAQPGGPVTEKF